MAKLSPKTKVVALSAVVASTAVVAYASNEISNHNNEANTDKAKLLVDKIDKDTVKISIDNVKDTVKAFQLSLKIDGNVKFLGGDENIKWLTTTNKDEADSSIINNYKLSNDKKTIDIFVTADSELQKKGPVLEVCEIKVDKVGLKSDSSYKILPNTEEGKVAYKSIDTNNSSTEENDMLSDDKVLSINTPPKIRLKESLNNGDTNSGDSLRNNEPIIDTKNNIIKIKEGYAFDAKEFVEVSDEEDTNIGKEEVKITYTDSNGEQQKVEGVENNLKSGSYERIATVEDSSGEKASLRMNVVVEPDVWDTKPTLVGVKDRVEVVKGGVFDPLPAEIKATDAKGNVLEVKLTGDFDLNEAGEYTLTYSAKDKFGNTVSATTILNVVENEAPVILGVEDITIKQGEDFDPKAGVSVNDRETKLTLDDLKISGTVNTAISKEYKLVYEISDGINTTKKTRIVTVTEKPKEDNEAPKFEYIGKTNIVLVQGMKFEEPVVSVTDNIDSDLPITKLITDKDGRVINNINTNVPGKYKIEYSTSDKSGNRSELIINVEIKQGIQGVEALGGDATNEKNPLEFKATNDASSLEDFIEKVKDDKYEPKVVGEPKIDNAKNEATYTIKLYKKQGLFAKLFNLNRNSNSKVYYIKVTVPNTEEFKEVMDALPKDNATNPPSTGGGGGTTPSTPATTVTKLMGSDRYETAVKISKEGWSTSSDTVIIVNGDNKYLVDGLTATPLASVKNAPILLSNSKALPKFTIDEIKRLSPKNVIVIGGENAIPQSIIDEIKKINSSISVKRIGGDDRYETSLNIAKEIDKTNDITKIYVGAGNGEADSLSIASVAGREKSPIILSKKDGLTKSIYDYIKSENVADGHIIGGPNSISDSAIDQINTAISKDISGNRISGSDRKETNAKVIEKFYTNTQLDGVIVAKENDLVDALTVGPLGAKKDMPVVLATNEVNKMQENILGKKKSPKVYEIGGGIKPTVIEKVKTLVNNRK